MTNVPLAILILITTLLIVMVVTKLAVWLFRSAVKAAIAPTHARVVNLERHERLIWDVAMQRAFEKLHHSDQPAFDLLLETFRSHQMSEQQLTQFIERLEVLTRDPQHAERQPAANLLLEAALLQREARHGYGGFADSEGQRDENITAGEVMAAEAKDKRLD